MGSPAKGWWEESKVCIYLFVFLLVAKKFKVRGACLRYMSPPPPPHGMVSDVSIIGICR